MNETKQFTFEAHDFSWRKLKNGDYSVNLLVDAANQIQLSPPVLIENGTRLQVTITPSE